MAGSHGDHHAANRVGRSARDVRRQPVEQRRPRHHLPARDEHRAPDGPEACPGWRRRATRTRRRSARAAEVLDVVARRDRAHRVGDDVDLRRAPVREQRVDLARRSAARRRRSRSRCRSSWRRSASPGSRRPAAASFIVCQLAPEPLNPCTSSTGSRASCAAAAGAGRDRDESEEGEARARGPGGAWTRNGSDGVGGRRASFSRCSSSSGTAGPMRTLRGSCSGASTRRCRRRVGRRRRALAADDPRDARVIASPLRRTRQTAEAFGLPDRARRTVDRARLRRARRPTARVTCPPDLWREWRADPDVRAPGR